MRGRRMKEGAGSYYACLGWRLQWQCSYFALRLESLDRASRRYGICAATFDELEETDRNAEAGLQGPDKPERSRRLEDHRASSLHKSVR